MLILDASDEIETRYVIHRAVRTSGLSLKDISERLNDEYGVKLSRSGVSHVITRGFVRPQRALQILAICGVTEIEIKG
jgi:hypothetical protein